MFTIRDIVRMLWANTEHGEHPPSRVPDDHEEGDSDNTHDVSQTPPERPVHYIPFPKY